MHKEGINNILFRRVTRDILLELLKHGEHYATELAKNCNVTYSHVWVVLHTLEKEGLINTKKEGRIVWIEVQPKGIRVANKVSEILQILKK